MRILFLLRFDQLMNAIIANMTMLFVPLASSLCGESLLASYQESHQEDILPRFPNICLFDFFYQPLSLILFKIKFTIIVHFNYNMIYYII
jgi:hypothetical protein